MADVAMRAVISLVVFGAAGLFVWSLFNGVVAWLHRKEEEFARRLNEMFFFDFSPRLAAQLSVASILSVALFSWLVFQSLFVAILGGLLGFFLPNLVMRYLLFRRKRKLDSQLSDGILTIASGVRASLNLVQSLQLVEANHPAPISQEVGLILREYEHGLGIEDALGGASARLSSANYRLVFSALRTSREKGGDLAETLDRIAESLREIYRLEEKVKTTTAQGRYSAMVMGLMPFVVAGILWMIDAEGFTMAAEFVANDWRGHVLFLIIVALIGAGFAWIWRIVDIDV